EIEVALHPIDAVVEFLVEPHDPQSVERFNQRQAKVMVLQREAFDPTADRLDLVLAPRALAIMAPGPTHFLSDVFAERLPILLRAPGCRRGDQGRGASSEQGAAGQHRSKKHSPRLARAARARYCGRDAA